MHESKRQHQNEPLRSPEERDRIIKRRAQLQRALINALVKRDTDPQQSDAQIATLVADYGAAEVERMMDRVTRQFQRPRDPEAEEAWLYNEYLQLYRRFGGTRRLLTAEELAAFRLERARLMMRRACVLKNDSGQAHAPLKPRVQGSLAIPQKSRCRGWR